MPATGGPRAVVLDTNVALDLFVFADPSVLALRAALASGSLVWWVLPGMREEFLRVLGYPRLLPQLAARRLGTEELLAAFDGASRCSPPVPACPVRCADPDDQPFLDLAFAHHALLLSKDRAVLATRRPLAHLGVQVVERFVTTACAPETCRAAENERPAGTLHD